MTCIGGCYAMQAGAGCDYNGKTYAVGATYPASDGCNTCTCGDSGATGCTTMACVCDPATEWNKNYVGSPSNCPVIDFVCPDNTTMFANECGCGCQQDPSCPEWFDCMPSPGTPPCDTQALQARCPYSGFAF